MIKGVIKNKEKNAIFVASKVMQILADYNNYNNNTYLNVSTYDDNVEVAPVASRVMHQPVKLGLSGLPGASPGLGASALFEIGITNQAKCFENSVF